MLAEILTKTLRYAAIAVALSLLPISAPAQDSAPDPDLAKKLANPIASLISVPFQLNYDQDIGPEQDGSQWLLNIQPVIPFSIGEDWNVITRTIVPVLNQDDIPGPGMGDSGLGDIVASQFFSPRAQTASGWTWGIGPVWLLPTASDDSLGKEKWGLGPTGVALKQQGPWTYGVLANHIWSFAGDSDRADVNTTFLQPFLTYITRTRTTFALNTESSYDWDSEQWSVPINLQVSQLLKLGKMPLQLTLGARYWADSTPSGPDGWGGRFAVTLIFPR